MDRRFPTSPGIPAPYGRACTNCSQSKCKCITRQVGGRCERCHRLNKECRPSARARRRNPTKTVVSKAAVLEQKLDGLVSLLQAGLQPITIGAHNHAPASTYETPHHSGVQTNDKTSPLIEPGEGPVAGVLNDYVPDVPALSVGTTGSENTLFNSPGSILHDAFEPSPAEAEEYLTTFHTYQSKYFPFVYIPLTTTAQQFRQERPFLWLCIMAIASKSTSLQETLGSKIRQTIAEEVVLKSEKNIDLLLGLLACVAWSNFQMHCKPSLFLFTQLAMSLVYSLGLNKPPSKDLQMVLCISPEKYPKAPTIRTLEERRAALGCYLITSIVSSFLQKTDALRWTPHMHEHLQVLNERQECPNDEILVQQVRLQLIVEKITLGACHDGAMENVEHPRAHPSFLSHAFHSQLQEVKNNLPPQSQSNEVVLTHLYSTELAINEIALSQLTITNHLDFQNLKWLCACIGSIKSWFEVFFTIPPAAYIGFPFSIFSQLVHCLVTLYRLSTLSNPTWDCRGVRDTADLLLIMDRVISNMEQVSINAEFNSNDSTEQDVFSCVAKRFRSVRPVWEAKLELDESRASNIPTLQNFSETPHDDVLPLEYFDNDWLMGLLASPN